MKLIRSNQVAVAACTSELQPDGSLRLIPDGLFKARDGRPENLPGWFLNPDTVQNVLARLAAKVDRILIDYEHQTLYTRENGQPAPAAGWFAGAQVEYLPGDGLRVTPQWTEAAKAAIVADEYKYFSPVIVYDKTTGEVLDIQMGAITNFAAIDGLGELQAAAAAKFRLTPTEEEPMKELLKLFGLAEGAAEQQAIEALKALQAKATTQGEQIDALKGQALANDEAIAAAKAATDPAKFVPVAAVQELQTEIAALKARQDQADIETLVTQGIADGKLRGETMQTWARGLKVTALKGYLDNTPAIDALKGTQTEGKHQDGSAGGELSDTDLAVCKQLGISEDDYKATAATTH